MTGRDVPIAGWGVVAPSGFGASEFWDGVVSGRSEVGTITTFDASSAMTNVVGQIPDMGRLPSAEDPTRLVASTVAAVVEACEQAGWNDLGEVDLVVGTTDSVGPGFDEAYVHGGLQPAILTGEIAELVGDAVGLGGARLVTGSASAAGLVAVGLGLDLAAEASERRVVIAAVDTITRAAYFGLNSIKTLSAAGCRPFSRKRRGIRIGEAAGALAIGPPGRPAETSQRNSLVLAGAGVSNCARGWARPEPEGIVLAITSSLDDSGVLVDDIDYVNLHGPGTKHGDASEIAALLEVFGPRLTKISLNSSKPVLTHCQGAAGLVELLVTAMVVSKGVVPATHGLDDVEKEWSTLDLCAVTRSKLVRCGLSISCGLGGINAAAVVRRVVT